MAILPAHCGPLRNLEVRLSRPDHLFQPQWDRFQRCRLPWDRIRPLIAAPDVLDCRSGRLVCRYVCALGFPACRRCCALPPVT